jgi:hypothetical protein
MIVVAVMAFRDYRRHKKATMILEEEENRDWIAEIFG